MLHLGGTKGRGWGGGEALFRCTGLSCHACVVHLPLVGEIPRPDSENGLPFGEVNKCMFVKHKMPPEL